MWQPNKEQICRGSDTQIAVFLLDQNGDPFSISGASAIKIMIKNADGSVLTKDAASGFAWRYGNPIYVYSFNISGAESSLLPIGPNQSVEIEVLFGTLTQKHEIRGFLSVIDPAI